MSFLWADALWLAALLPALVAGYLVRDRRRGRWLQRHPGFRAGAEPAPERGRHVAPALLLLALACLVAACARPAAVVSVLARQHTVILAIDVSPSMRAEDVPPNRLAAAQSAASAFVESLPKDVRIGVVAYAGSAALVQPPTRDRDAISTSIDLFAVQPGTAIGYGLLASLAAIFPEAGIPLDELARGGRGPGGLELHRDAADPPAAGPGSYAAAEIVLLSDGQNTRGIDPLEAARLAADLGVKVFTVGFGTARGDTLEFGTWSIHVRLDEGTLRSIAEITRGEYFAASTATELRSAFRAMEGRLAAERREVELTALFAAAAAVLLAASGGLALWRTGRVI